VSRLRVVFMGSPEFAVPTLRALLQAADVVAVVTQPDKPAGRGQKLQASPVKQVAEAAGIPVLEPRSARTPEFLEQLRGFAPDVAVVVAYGKILPQAVLDVPRLGCLNVHASLLPKYRGAAPIQWALIRGETETGVTIMKLDAGMDTGPMLLWGKVRIHDEDTAGTLARRLSGLGAELMVVALERLRAGALPEMPQDHALATMAPLLQKAAGRVDWTRPAAEVRGLVRGVDPWPGAYTELDGQVLKLWGARVAEGGGAPGQVLGAPGEVLGVDAEGVIVACGEGAVAIAELQLPGKKRLAARAFAAGHPLPAGARLGG
jgi:methionyl-tRNA formyltransferase